MKSIKYIIISLFSLFLGACNLLDIDESTGMTCESVFELTERSKQFLTNIYTYLPSDYKAVGGTSRSCATDDAHYVWDNTEIKSFNDGTWSAINTVDAQWSYYYTGIRACNQFLDNFSLKALEKWNYQTNYDAIKMQFINYQHEARFLRALFHFELSKRYGAIPLGNRQFTEKEVNSLPKNSFQEVLRFIVDECDATAAVLPHSYTTMLGVQETGRVTKGAALALKAKALLYAASPLHNPTNDLSRWQEAAMAAKVLIDSAEIRGWYQLTTTAFDVNKIDSKELILETRESAQNYYEKANYPIGFEGGNTGICPSQNLVDAYEMTAASGGGPFDWNNPNHKINPFTNRDVRLSKTILLDQAKFKGTTINIAENGENGLPKVGATPTGYYVRKFLIESINLTPGNTTTAIHTWPVIRYADVLLMYAEAMNEAFPASSAYSDATFTYSAQWALNKVRNRSKVLPVKILNYSDFQAKVRNERRVELAFEDSRFWDIRRWNIGDQCRTIYGTKIQDVDGVRLYTPNQVVATRIWNNRMNLYPIPSSQVLINPLLTQNPNW